MASWAAIKFMESNSIGMLRRENAKVARFGVVQIENRSWLLSWLMVYPLEDWKIRGGGVLLFERLAALSS